jgi:hypothetical protein
MPDIVISERTVTVSPAVGAKVVDEKVGAKVVGAAVGVQEEAQSLPAGERP